MLDDDELQPDASIDTDVSDSQNEDAGSAPDEEEKVSFDDRQQKVFNEAIGDKTRKIHEERRAKEEAERQLAELRSSQPKETRPDIPELPDPLDVTDVEFKTAQQKREEQIAHAATFDERQKTRQERDQAQVQAEQQRQNERARTVVEGYAAKVKSSGIDQAKLAEAAQTLAASGITQDLTMHILGDDDGPHITAYLATDLALLDEVLKLSPMRQAAFMETDVKPKVAAARKGTSAPDPAKRLTGGGKRPLERGPAGAKFS